MLDILDILLSMDMAFHSLWLHLLPLLRKKLQLLKQSVRSVKLNLKLILKLTPGTLPMDIMLLLFTRHQKLRLLRLKRLLLQQPCPSIHLWTLWIWISICLFWIPPPIHLWTLWIWISICLFWIPLPIHLWIPCCPCQTAEEAEAAVESERKRRDADADAEADPAVLASYSRILNPAPVTYTLPAVHHGVYAGYAGYPYASVYGYGYGFGK